MYRFVSALDGVHSAASGAAIHARHACTWHARRVTSESILELTVLNRLKSLGGNFPS